MLIQNFKVAVNKAEVFEEIGCYPESDLYDEFSEEYEEILEEIVSLCNPVCLIEYTDLKDQTIIRNAEEDAGAYVVLYSIGRKISDYSTKCFQEGDYVKGMLINAMADSALFSMEKEVELYLKQMCEHMQLGISSRLEAPHDVPMEIQKYVYDITKAKELCGFEMSTGYMIDPVKSNVILFMLTKDKDIFAVKHDCRKCQNYTCRHRKELGTNITVIDGNRSFVLTIKERQSILEALVSHDKRYSAVCGGNGKCGKCGIRLTAGTLPITESDRKIFSEEELKKGKRLSCKAFPLDEVTIELNFKKEMDYQIITEGIAWNKTEAADISQVCGIAIDIGTTTIAMQLIDLERKKLLGTYTTVNHQRRYGADVIARIKASIEGKKEQLHGSVISDLSEGIHYLMAESKIPKERITKVVISGNTTMIHLLMGYDCKGLGEYPFTPENIELQEVPFETLFHTSELQAKVTVLPGISAFVGGDIVSGLYACDVDDTEEYFLLVDLGTNGEMAVGNRERILVTSAAAGPAFEGGNITHGTGSIEGAISNVSIVNGEAKITTIGDVPPTGICGTGVIEIVAELVRAGYVDETGYLDENRFGNGYVLAQKTDGQEIIFTQQDVREVQLAKAAVRAAVETLLLRYGISKEQVSNVYIAGGFGYRLDCRKAIEIGMLPEEFSTKVKTVGNSSLSGAVQFLLSEDGYKKVKRITTISKEINLSADVDFNQLYIDYMYFQT